MKYERRSLRGRCVFLALVAGALLFNSAAAQFSSITRNGFDIVVTFEAIQGRTYRLERKLNITDSTWESIFGVNDFTAPNNGSAQITDPGALSLGHAFYQVNPTWNLTTATAGAGTGTVSFPANPVGVSCGPNCNSYSNGTMVTLTAAPDALSFLAGWSAGGCPPTSSTCTVTVTESSTVTATFGHRPVTTITRGPPPATNSNTLTVEFSSDVAGSTFECDINGGMPAPCTSPRVYSAVGSGIPVTIQVTAIDPAGIRDLSPAVATTTTTVASNPPPVLRYAFDGNGTNSGAAAGFPATFNNVTFPTGKFGNAVKFNGTSATTAVIAGTNASFWSSTSSKWTVGFWFRQDIQVDNAGLLKLRGSQGWETYDGIGAGGNLITCATPPNFCNSFIAPPTQQWHHLLYRYDAASYTSGAALNIYLDDVLLFSITAGATPLVGPGVPDLLLGSGIGTSHFYVDELKIYDNVYSQATQCTMIIGGTWNGTSCILP